MTDRLAEVKARRAGVPDPPYSIDDTVTEEEFYMQWRLIQHGPTDAYGDRDWWAALPADRADHAEFIANAPTDIDWLVGRIETLEADLSALRAALGDVEVLARGAATDTYAAAELARMVRLDTTHEVSR